MGKKDIKSSRNVLALPEEPFWPKLEKPEIETSLLEELTETLKVAKTIQPQLKWSEYRKMNKEQKAKHVEEFFMNLSAEEQVQHHKAKQLKTYLAIGINEVSRGLEKEELACCLIHGKAKPKIIITHVIQLAHSRRVPVLIVDDLKQSTKESLGFSSLAIGFLKEVSESELHEFHELCKHIINLSKGFIKDLEEPTSIVHDSKKKLEDTGYKKSVDTTFTQMVINSSSLYLYRTSSDYRVFHPPDDESISGEAGGMDISKDKLDTEVLSNDCPIPNKKTKFIQPTILRVQSNPDKVRKRKRKKNK
ncbi:ribonuclease P protein subunit p38 [Halyomorpha halys]|uniref:ribonuclease P protein subunit p38 n=1 Tax=Halyomorpha halys TaxID=286706 RepID=UPI0006D50CBA|nr:ribonuclease P protein subunit p38-like [Halyomorpha halys]